MFCLIVQVKTLTREKTRVETSLQKKERVAQDAHSKIGELTRDVLEQREHIADLEREIVSYKADRDRLLALEKQLAAASSDAPSEVRLLLLFLPVSGSCPIYLLNYFQENVFAMRIRYLACVALQYLALTF